MIAVHALPFGAIAVAHALLIMASVRDLLAFCALEAVDELPVADLLIGRPLADKARTVGEPLLALALTLTVLPLANIFDA